MLSDGLKKMVSLEPLKSVISIGNVDDTSLALPSITQCRSGQQRVLEQVQTIRRTKSRHSSTSRGSTLSPTTPTSPSYDSVFFESPKSQSGISNGGLYYGNGLSGIISHENRPLNNNKGTSVKMNTAATTYQYEKAYGPVCIMPVGLNDTSRSEPDFARQRSVPKISAASQRLPSNRGTYRTERTTSQFITRTGSQHQPQFQSQSQYQYQSQPQLQAQSQYQSQPQIQSQSQYQSQPQPQIQSQSQYQSQPQIHLQTQSQYQSQPQIQAQSQYQSQPKPQAQSQYQAQSQFQSVRQSQSHFQSQPQLPPQPSFTMNGTSQTKANNGFLCGKIDQTKTTSKTVVTETDSKTKEDSLLNGSGVADITMKEAVEYLSNGQDAYQHCGASYIQHNTYIDDKAKEEVLKLNGIAPLVGLLRSPSSQVSQTASAALRNLSFKSSNNKEEIQRAHGIEEAAALLRDTDSVEIQKQLTGLLWNLSSVDSLKPDLLKSALPVLMERVILPYTTGPDRSSQDPEAFFHATGCLRNLSSTKQSNRQAMRKCRGLVDSLDSYVKDCVDAGNPDDKALENCVCILHNLTFQLEAEAPALFNRMTALARTVNRGQSQSETGPIGCFSPQSKSSEVERNFDFPVVEDPQPNGAGRLLHSSTLQNYLSVLSTSQREETQEACCGALQNLTTNEGIVSSVMSQTIVQKLNGLQVITPLLKSKKVNIQRNAVALLGNLSRNPNLQNTIARKALPDLLAILSAGTKEGNESDDTLAMACQTSSCLLMKDPDMGKHLLNGNLIRSLKELSQDGYFPKSSKAAAMLLYKMWSDKELQSHLKKKGMPKSSFVNDITTAAHKSAQVVD
ncbi:plakophilin-1-like [Centropristis striata]|uniref:plakophilin-1-like n=1 Tax=Centropristis striata TaxID=184440 RepID=UPI0027DFB406|nr:plakophilin-1-like [Centropristis striata]